MKNTLLEDLTEAQKQAVMHMNGPMLVVAGAGSGKTRVVTRRVAYLIASGIRPWRILALTFTNKAAKEMRSRVESLVGDAPTWMGTFHSICARFLRSDLHLLDCGRDTRFSIMDQTDQEGLVKQALKSMGMNDKSQKPSAILAAISNAKSNMISYENFSVNSWRDEIIVKVYEEYEKSLRLNNALDFDDLLLQAVNLLQKVPGVVERYRQRFPYLLVDEYQDTNRVQYLLLKLLAGSAANIHATGDPDQSIYSWRGADYRNIMDFQNDFPGAKLVRLEQNYRSTKTILAAANQLIRNNSHRIEKDLFTENPQGEKITVAALQSDAMEAAWIAEEISKLKRENAEYKDTAVFYRTNAQSRALEESFMRAGIPYQLIGGIRFYERREVKDLLAHLKIRVNPRDIVSLRRIVNCRSTGVGEKTLAKAALAAEEADMAVFNFLAHPDFATLFKPNKKTLQFAKWCQKLATVPMDRADQAVKDIVAVSGLVEELLLSSDKDEMADERIENLHSLTARAMDFVKFRLETAPAAPMQGDGELMEDRENINPTAIDLPSFLEDVALVADVDSLEDKSDKTTLMTLHSAKGLEFPYVFLSGLEEGLLPHRNASDDRAVEEERRLFYVGLTRAEKKAWISRSEWRYAYGSSDYAPKSRFLQELPEEVIVDIDFADPLSTEYGSGFSKSAVGATDAFDGIDDIWENEDFTDFDPLADDFSDTNSASPAQEEKRKNYSLHSFKTTGKKTLNIHSSSSITRSPAFAAGDLVRHPEFGSGKVFSVERNKILVQFFGSGTKMLFLDQARLSKE